MGCDVFAHFRQSDYDDTEALDRFFGNLGVHVRDVFAQFVDDFLDVVVAGDLGEDVQLEVLDVARLVVLDEELLELAFENDVGATEDKQVNV